MTLFPKSPKPKECILTRYLFKPLISSGEVFDKAKLRTSTTDEHEYVEDPFDLKHNMAG